MQRIGIDLACSAYNVTEIILKVTLVAGNLFTITPYNGTDPETQTPFGYPNTRNYTLTLNIGL